MPGQFAAVIVHVFGVPVQPVSAVAPAASDESFAPVISAVPAASLVTLIVAESMPALARFACVES